MTNPLISVIIPAYNIEEYIGQAIQSIVDQTYTNIEIIVINDGSTDSTQAVIESFAALDSRIVVINQSNSGLIVVRKIGLAASCGEYICFLDGDDYLTTDAVEVLYQNLIDNDLDISIGGYYRKSDNYIVEISPKSNYLLTGNDLLKWLLINKMPGFVWSRIYKRSLLEGVHYNSLITLGEDKFINLQVATLMPRVGMITKPLCYYVKRGESISHQRRPMAYYISMENMIEEELKSRLTASEYKEIEKHLILLKSNTYYIYINSTSNPTLAKETYVEQLYEQMERPEVIALMKEVFTPTQRLIIQLHRHPWSAPVGRLVTTISRISTSISKRLGLRSEKQ